MQARRAMAKDGDRVASRGRGRAAAKRRRGRPRKRRGGGGWRSSIAEAAGGAASVASLDSLSLSRPAWRAAPPYSDVRRAYLESPRAGAVRTGRAGCVAARRRRPDRPVRTDQRCALAPRGPARQAATPSELRRGRSCRVFAPTCCRAFALRAAASTRRNASPRRKNRSSCTFFEVRCTNAPVSGRFPSLRPARTCERSGEQCDDLRFYETDRREGDGGVPARRADLQRTSKNVHETAFCRRADNEPQKMCTLSCAQHRGQHRRRHRRQQRRAYWPKVRCGGCEARRDDDDADGRARGAGLPAGAGHGLAVRRGARPRSAPRRTRRCCRRVARVHGRDATVVGLHACAHGRAQDRRRQDARIR